ncbi:MAG: hypothetical protein RIE08_03550 [Acidimicrobiales bacterium]
MPAPLDPECLFAVLADHSVDYVLIGGLAGVLHGSTVMTNDADVVPSRDPENLRRLSAALVDLGACLRTDDSPDGFTFDPHPALLASMAMLNMTTRCGDLDLTFEPAGLEGFAKIDAAAVTFEVFGRRIRVASLADIIRSKEAADRPRDHVALPVLRALQEEILRSGSEAEDG